MKNIGKKGALHASKGHKHENEGLSFAGKLNLLFDRASGKLAINKAKN